MSAPNGESGQRGAFSVGGTSLQCTRVTTRKVYSNADTTVFDNGWSQLCPIFRDWFVDVEIPFTSSTHIDALFDTSDYGSDSPTGQTSNWTDNNGSTYSGTVCLDGEYKIDSSAKDAVRLAFTCKGTGALTGPG